MLLHLLIFRAMPGPHPCLPPEGEGEKTRGERIHLSRLYSLPRWGRVRGNPMHPHYLPDHRLCVLPLPLVGEGRGEGDSFPPPLGEG